MQILPPKHRTVPSPYLSNTWRIIFLSGAAQRSLNLPQFMDDSYILLQIKKFGIIEQKGVDTSSCLCMVYVYGL